jgi:hypothetical protein
MYATTNSKTAFVVGGRTIKKENMCFKSTAVRNVVTVAVGNWSSKVELGSAGPGGKVPHMSLQPGDL